MPIEALIQTVQQLSSEEIAALLDKRGAEDKALRTLLAAARRRERAERQQQRERQEGSCAG